MNESLLAAVLADPGDDTPRLVLADWLMEHGATAADRARGEYIAMAIRHEKAASGPFSNWVRSWEPDFRRSVWCRGFMVCVWLTEKEWLTRGPGLVNRHPLERVILTDKDPHEDDDGTVVTFDWWRSGRNGKGGYHPESDVADEIFAHIGERGANVGEQDPIMFPTWKCFTSRESALAELYRAALAWALGEAAERGGASARGQRGGEGGAMTADELLGVAEGGEGLDRATASAILDLLEEEGRSNSDEAFALRRCLSFDAYPVKQGGSWYLSATKLHNGDHAAVNWSTCGEAYTAVPTLDNGLLRTLRRYAYGIRKAESR